MHEYEAMKRMKDEGKYGNKQISTKGTNRKQKKRKNVMSEDIMKAEKENRY